MRRSLLAVGFLFLVTPAFSQDFSHVKVELLPEQNSITPGGSVTVGFHFRMARGWHIYWKNPGDSGQAPSINWTLPDGFTAGDILWPTPQLIPLNSLADYGYTNEVFLMVPIQAPPNVKPGHLERLTAHVRWLVCNEICIPGDTSLNLRFQVHKRKSTVKTRNEFLFQNARRNQPQDLPDGWKIYGSVGKKDFRIGVETGGPVAKTTTAVFIPLHQNQIEAAPSQVFHASGNSFQLTVRKSDQLSSDVKTLDGVLVIKEKKATRGYDVSIPLSE
ncbi:MAG TPA: protein-disulfide reductase DsbD domain-containing protein [bacterium]|nr:protein-disulfide reductase DsbD domain-containing protein [bacterium]